MISLKSRNIYYFWVVFIVLMLTSLYFLVKPTPKNLPQPTVYPTSTIIEKKPEPIKNEAVFTGSSLIITGAISEVTQEPEKEAEDELPKRIDITFWWILKWLPFTMDGWCENECDKMASEIGAIYTWDDQKPNDYENELIHDAVITITCWSLANKPCSNSDKIFDASLSFGTHKEFMLQQDKKNMGNAYKYAENVYFYERDIKYLESFLKNVLPWKNTTEIMTDGLSWLKSVPETWGADYIELWKYFSKEYWDLKLQWFMPSNRPYFSITVSHR